MSTTTTSATAPVNNITIAYTIHTPTPTATHDKAPPSTSAQAAPLRWIILINGLADEKESWACQTPALTKRGYTVLTFDNRGVGSSSCPTGPYSAEIMAKDTKALLTYLGIERFHLCGISMGGMLAQRFAIDYPQGIVSLTLACTYAAPSPFCTRMFNLWADTASVMGVSHVMRDVLLWCFTPGFFSDQHRGEELTAFEDGMRFMTMSTPAYLAQLAVIQRFDVRDEIRRLEEIGVPIMVLAGEEDILIPTNLSRELQDLISGSVWQTCKGGHGCSWEAPDEFNHTLLDFIMQADLKPS